MDNGGGGLGLLAMLAALVIGGIAVEMGMVSGGVYDVIRIVVLMVVVAAAVGLVVLAAFLIWTAKHPQGTGKVSANGKTGVHVHSSSADEAAGVRYAEKREDPLPQGTVPKAGDADMREETENAILRDAGLEDVVADSQGAIENLSVAARDADGTPK